MAETSLQSPTKFTALATVSLDSEDASPASVIIPMSKREAMDLEAGNVHLLRIQKRNRSLRYVRLWSALLLHTWRA
jgi:hypothetical protein